jgi:hypothetical protein
MKPGLILAEKIALYLAVFNIAELPGLDYLYKTVQFIGGRYIFITGLSELYLYILSYCIPFDLSINTRFQIIVEGVRLTTVITDL